MRDLRDRFATLDGRSVPDLWPEVERRVADLARTQPLTGVRVRGAVRRSGSEGRGIGLPIAAALLVAGVAGAIAVGSGLISGPNVVLVPAPSPTPPASPSASVSVTQPSPSAQASEPVAAVAPWIVFQVDGPGAALRETRLWAMRADGSDAHEILAGGYMTVAWSRDGSRLLLNDGRLRVANVSDEIGPFVDTGIAVPDAAQWEAFDFAPDGEHVVFVERTKCARGSADGGSDGGSGGIVLAVYVAETAGADCWTLTTVDLRTTKRVQLSRTLVKDQTATENRALELPAWSPDGTKIAYAVVDEAHGTSELWVVDRDGSNPSKVVLDAAVPVQGPRWSPDGTRIAFTAQTWLSASESDSAIEVVDLATGHLTRLAIGPSSAVQHVCCADWIDDARLRVQGIAADDGTRFWAVPAAGGSDEPALVADLTDALGSGGLPGRPTMRSAPGDPGRTFFWQPVLP